MNGELYLYYRQPTKAIIFLFPNEQNQRNRASFGNLWNSFGRLSLNFVFSPVPDLSDTGIK
jgi:hypothetical protein